MLIHTPKLSEGENLFEFNTEEGGWLNRIKLDLEKRGFRFSSPLQTTFKFTKLEPNYYLQGDIRFSIEQTCARCADEFLLPIEQHFDIAFTHLITNKRHKFAGDLNAEAMDINFFEGPDIDISPIFEEQFFLSLPYQAICRENCQGLCQGCGANLNGDVCHCKKNNEHSPLNVLEKIKNVPS